MNRRLSAREQAVLLAAVDVTDLSLAVDQPRAHELVAHYLDDPDYEPGNAIVDVVEKLLADRGHLDFAMRCAPEPPPAPGFPPPAPAAYTDHDRARELELEPPVPGLALAIAALCVAVIAFAVGMAVGINVP